MVGLCLSSLGFDTGLRENDGFTVFNLALCKGDDFLVDLFYTSMIKTDETSPQVTLFCVLILSSGKSVVKNRLVFPGEALFQPIDYCHSPLVMALLTRGVDLTATKTAT